MPEYITVTEKIERRTYLKGFFTGKFIGFLDPKNSDFRTENFFDIEITEAKIKAHRTDFRLWQQGDQFEEFFGVEKFITKLPNPILCEVVYKDGSVKHFNLNLHEPKLKNYELTDSVYEREQLFATIRGEISGYLKHFDTVEKQVEKILPEPIIVPETLYQSGSSRNNFSSQQATSVGRESKATNAGCAPLVGCSTIPGGCLSLLAILLFAYLCLAVLALLLSALANVFSGVIGTAILSFLFSVLIPFFIISSLLYLFVRLQENLALIWKFLFKLLIIILIFFFLLN